MAAHAKLSASASSRWLNSPGSVRLTQDIPDHSSPFAREGTAAHEVGEKCLRNGTDAADYEGEQIKVESEIFNVDKEMVEAVQQYVDFVREINADDLHVEQRVDYSPWAVPDSFGTADAVVIDWKNRHLTICDYKHGTGVKVSAENNSQLKLYALGCINEYGYLGKIDTVTLAIVQPRIEHIETWDVDVADLLTWGEKVVRPTAELAMSDDAPVVPGEKQCQWCKISATCKAQAEHHLAVVGQQFDNLDEAPRLPDVNDVSAEQMSYTLTHAKAITKWLGKVDKHAYEILLHGGTLPGLKLVEGRSIRRWCAADEVVEGELDLTVTSSISSDDLYTRKIKSPTQLEKLMGKTDFANYMGHLVEKSTGKPTLVPESDKRPPFELSKALGFEDISDSQEN